MGVPVAGNSLLLSGDDLDFCATVLARRPQPLEEPDIHGGMLSSAPLVFTAMALRPTGRGMAGTAPAMLGGGMAAVRSTMAMSAAIVMALLIIWSFPQPDIDVAIQAAIAVFIVPMVLKIFRKGRAQFRWIGLRQALQALFAFRITAPDPVLDFAHPVTIIHGFFFLIILFVFVGSRCQRQ